MGKKRMDANWERVKTQILSVWAGLDESALKSARGDFQQMITLIHETTGEDRAQIMRKMATLI